MVEIKNMAQIQAPSCLECNEVGEGGTLQCGSCLKPIHAKCLRLEREELKIENILNIEVFRSLDNFYYICKDCKEEVDAFFVNMSKKKLIKDLEEQSKEAAEIESTTEPPQTDAEGANQTANQNDENVENRRRENANYNNKRIICKFANTGNCYYNDKCRKKHTDISNICRYYMRTGRCGFNNCKYEHPSICRAAQQNNCYRKSCDSFHANQQQTEYRKDRQDRQSNYENKRYPMRKNENQGNFLENMMRDLQQQLGYMQKMMMPQNPRFPNGPPIYPQFPPMAFPPPPPQQPPLGRPY